MKFILPILLLLLLGCSENNSNPKTFSEWTNTANLQYEVKKATIAWTGDSIVKDERNMYMAQLLTQNIGEINQIKWRLYVPDSNGIIVTTELNQLDDKLPGFSLAFEIDYSISENGRFDEIQNWNEVESYWDSLFISRLKEENVILNTDDSTFQIVKKALGTQPMIEARITTEMQAFHMMYGLPLDTSTTVFPINSVGLDGAPVKSLITTKILEEDENYMVVRITNQMNSNSIKDQMSELFETIKSGSSQDFDSTMVSINDTCLTYFNKLTETPYYVEYWRTARMDSINQKQHIIIDQK